MRIQTNLKAASVRILEHPWNTIQRNEEIKMLDANKIENAKQRKHLNKEYVNKQTAGLLGYYSDPNKKVRLASGLCKYCYYIKTNRIGGAAMTSRKCDCCNEDMMFGSTCTDSLCLKCALEIKHCKHCSQKLD
jgi:hypothetical protein